MRVQLREPGVRRVRLTTEGVADEGVMRAEEKLFVENLNTEALSAPMQTEAVCSLLFAEVHDLHAYTRTCLYLYPLRQQLTRRTGLEQPILDIPSTAYFHGPMPDKAITQVAHKPQSLDPSPQTQGPLRPYTLVLCPDLRS